MSSCGQQTREASPWEDTRVLGSTCGQQAREASSGEDARVLGCTCRQQIREASTGEDTRVLGSTWGQQAREASTGKDSTVMTITICTITALSAPYLLHCITMDSRLLPWTNIAMAAQSILPNKYRLHCTDNC